jgi:hypothetical protein
MSVQGWNVARDAVTFAVGIGGIVYQQLTGQVDVALLAVFTGMVGVPGVTNLLSLIRGGFGTNSPPSTSLSVQSEQESRP